MLRYSFGMEEEATAIEKAVNLTLDEGLRTRDMKGTASTTEIGSAIRKTLLELLNEQAL
jgi:3-isopropylmalate dehydrogenase